MFADLPAVHQGCLGGAAAARELIILSSWCQAVCQNMQGHVSEMREVYVGVQVAVGVSTGQSHL